MFEPSPTTLSSENKKQNTNEIESILVKVDNQKTHQVTKNGRYISRVIDMIEKYNKKDEMSQHDKSLLNLSLFAYLNILSQTSNHFDKNTTFEKFVKLSTLMNCFEKGAENYNHFLKIIHRELYNHIDKNMQMAGISPENFMKSNTNIPDLYGFSTYHNDTFINHTDFTHESNVKQTNIEKKLIDCVCDFDNTVSTVQSKTPDIIHVVYYKNKVDQSHLEKHLGTYRSANKDIFIWCNDNIYDEIATIFNNKNKTFVKTFNELEITSKTQEKYMLKYYILKQFGGICVDFSTYCIKDISNLGNTNFVSVFNAKLEDKDYFMPHGVFMSFTPNHPFINYILDNFESGCSICKTEYNYLRISLLKYSQHYQTSSNDTNTDANTDIKYLYQDINTKNTNKYYVCLYDKDEIKTIDYFSFNDYDDGQDEDHEDHDDEEEDEDEEKMHRNISHELEEMDNIVANIQPPKTNECSLYGYALFIFLFSVFFGWWRHGA